MSHTEQAEIKHQSKHLIEMGFVRTSKSFWASPLLFARKKNGRLRFCMEYRASNKFTVENICPITRNYNILHQFMTLKTFWTSDLRSGHHQLKISSKDIPETVLRTKYGHYDCKDVPLGFTNAPPAFMSTMKNVFNDYIDSFIMVHVGDVLVYSE